MRASWGGAPVLNPTTGLMETPIPAPTRLVAPDPFGGQASGNTTIIVAAVDTGRVNEPIRREPSYDAEIIGLCHWDRRPSFLVELFLKVISFGIRFSTTGRLAGVEVYSAHFNRLEEV